MKYITAVVVVFSIFVFCGKDALLAQELGGVRFLGHYIPPQGGAYIAGSWGWTDTTTGREYAILGGEIGTSIVEITDASTPVERDFVPGPRSSWREVQVHSHYAYVVTEASGGGTQIIDLSPLPDSVRLVQKFIYVQGDKNTGRVHTNHIRDGYLYLNGSATWRPGGTLIFDLADPENPAFVGEYAGTYFHDTYVRNDTLFGAAIYAGGGIDIIDIADKAFPQFLANISYPDAGTHNLSTTTDGRYLLSTDEIGRTEKTLKIWDLESGPPFTKVAEYAGDPASVVHNIFVKDTFAIMSYYTAGMRIVSIADPTNPIELGGYDTFNGPNGNYTGAWSVYPYFPSGKIIIGDMVSGLYIVDYHPEAPRRPLGLAVSSDYRTPTSVTLQWQDPTEYINGMPLGAFNIHIYRDTLLAGTVASGVQSFTDTGLIAHHLYAYKVMAVAESETSAAVTASIYAGGHAQSQPPASLSARSAGNGIVLTWKNPSTQLDGTPLNDLAWIDVFRDGSLADSVAQTSADTALERSYADTVVGFHSYRVRARDNEIPSNVSAMTDSVIGYGGLLSGLDEGFENWTRNAIIRGAWDTVSTKAVTGKRSLTDSPFGNYQNSATSWIMMPPVIITPGMVLEFWHIAIVALGDFGFIEYSRNSGKSFIMMRAFNWASHTAWQDGSADAEDWFKESFNLSAYAGDTLSFRFRLQTNSSTVADGWYIDDLKLAVVTGVADGDIAAAIPGAFALHQNYPNPFNPETEISFDVQEQSVVTLAVYDVLGREVALVVREEKAPGRHTVRWRAGETTASGVYYLRMSASDPRTGAALFTSARKVVVMK